MNKLLFTLLVVLLLPGCIKNEEPAYLLNQVQDGIYMGYFEYKSQNYWCEIEFNAGKYVEWPSGGVMFQKSYSCLTTGTYNLIGGQMNFFMDAYKMPGFSETCTTAMLLPGSYHCTDATKADSLIFENGATSNRIVYHLKKLKLN